MTYNRNAKTGFNVRIGVVDMYLGMEAGKVTGGVEKAIVIPLYKWQESIQLQSDKFAQCDTKDRWRGFEQKDKENNLKRSVGDKHGGFGRGMGCVD